MSKSLQEQLIGIGVASKKKAKQIKQEKRKKRKARGKKPPPPDAIKAKIVADAAAKARRDRELNRERDAGGQARAERSQIQQMIDAHRLSREGGEVAHRFVMGGKVKQLYVTQAQHAQLSDGRLRIAHADGRFELVDAAAAAKIAAKDRAAIVETGPSGDDADAQDYAGYEVPDDLMW